MIDATEIRRLWDLLPHPEDSVVRYSARKRVNGQDTGSGDFAETVEELIRAAGSWQRDGYNMYVQVNPTKERARSRPHAKDVTHWSWVLLDLDPMAVPDLDPAFALVTYVHRLSLETGTLLDPLVLDSGRGMQAWLRLPDLPLVDKRGESLVWPILRYVTPDGVMPADDVDPAEPIISTNHKAPWIARRAHGWWLRHLASEVGIVGGCALDTSVCDLPRLMRMPGTVNIKTGRMARIVSPGSVHERLADKLIHLTPAKEYEAPAPVQMLVEGRTWSDVWPILSLTAQNFLRSGKEEPGRHKDTVATVLSLRDAGLTPEATMAAVQKGNAMSLPEPLKQSELDRMVRDAFAKVVG